MKRDAFTSRTTSVLGTTDEGRMTFQCLIHWPQLIILRMWQQRSHDDKNRSSPLPERARRPVQVPANRCIPLPSRAIDSCWVICEAIHFSLPGHWLNYVNGTNDIHRPGIELLAPGYEAPFRQIGVRPYKAIRFDNKLQLVAEIKTLRSDRKCARTKDLCLYIKLVAS
jgi:hypothetical protein